MGKRVTVPMFWTIQEQQIMPTTPKEVLGNWIVRDNTGHFLRTESQWSLSYSSYKFTNHWVRDLESATLMTNAEAVAKPETFPPGTTEVARVLRVIAPAAV